MKPLSLYKLILCVQHFSIDNHSFNTTPSCVRWVSFKIWALLLTFLTLSQLYYCLWRIEITLSSTHSDLNAWQPYQRMVSQLRFSPANAATTSGHNNHSWSPSMHSHTIINQCLHNATRRQWQQILLKLFLYVLVLMRSPSSCVQWPSSYPWTFLDYSQGYFFNLCLHLNYFS